MDESDVSCFRAIAEQGILGKDPVLGYEKSAAIAKEALVTNRSVYELVLEKNLLTKIQLDDILKPENMTHPRQLTSRA